MQLQIEKLGKVSITVEEGYWDINKDYDKLTIVEKEGTFGTFISRKPVPAGTVLTDRKYWIPFSSLKEEIILNFNKWVSDYGALLGSQAETLNHIQEVINSIYSHLPNGVVFKGDIDSVRLGFEREIILEGKTINEEQATFILYKNNEEIYRSEDSNEFSISDIVTGDTEYKLVTIQNNYKYISTWNVAIALPLYAGGGQTYQDAVGDNKIVKISNDISGIYSIVIDKDGDYIFFVAPKGYLIKSIKMNGLDVPIKSTKKVYLGTDYVIYQSDYQYKAGTYPIQINEYTGLNGEDFLGILNSLGDTASAVDVANLKERIDNLPVNELIDKEYAPSKFSGMGRVYLRKNIKNGKNILEQDMMLKSNTIYIIQYDFDLDEKEITVPDNCILDFQGGSLNNGKIHCSNTEIKAKPIQIFNNVILSGITKSIEAYAEWFDSVIKVCKYFNNIKLLNKTYIIEESIKLRSNFCIKGSGNTIINAINCNAIEGDDTYSSFITIKDLRLLGDKTEHSGIHILKAVSKFIIDNLHISNFGNYGIYLLDSWDQSITNVNVSSNKIGLYAHSANSSNFNKLVSFQNKEEGVIIESSAMIYLSGTVQENGKTGLLLKGIYGGNINVYGEQNGFEGTTNISKSEIGVTSGGSDNHTSTRIFINAYLNGGKTSDMASPYGIYLEWCSNNVIQGLIFDHVITDIYETSTSSGNIINGIVEENKTKLHISEKTTYRNAYTSFGELASLPETPFIQDGSTFFDITNLRFVFWINKHWSNLHKKDIGNKWVTSEGKTVATIKGASNIRPTNLNSSEDVGYCYFDTTLGKPIYWTGTKWVDATGVDITTTQTE